MPDPTPRESELIQSNKEMQSQLQNLTRALGKSNPAFKAAHKEYKGNTHQAMVLGDKMGNVKRSLENLHVDFGELGNDLAISLKSAFSPIDALVFAITDGLKTAEEIQKSALKLGMNVNDIIRQFPKEMTKSTGGLVRALDSTTAGLPRGITTGTTGLVTALGSTTAGLTGLPRGITTGTTGLVTALGSTTAGLTGLPGGITTGTTPLVTALGSTTAGVAGLPGGITRSTTGLVTALGSTTAGVAGLPGGITRSTTGLVTALDATTVGVTGLPGFLTRNTLGLTTALDSTTGGIPPLVAALGSTTGGITPLVTALDATTVGLTGLPTDMVGAQLGLVTALNSTTVGLTGLPGGITGTTTPLVTALDATTVGLTGLPGGMTRSTTGLTTALTSTTTGITGSITPLTGVIPPLVTAVGTATAATTRSTTGLTAALDSTTGGITGSSDRLVTALDSNVTRSGKQLDKFSGDMADVTGGFTAAIHTTMTQVDIGLRDLGEYTVKAGIREEVLGGNLAGLVRAQRRMETHLGFNSEQVNSSSKHMIELSQHFNISTQRLVTSLDGLASHMSTFAALDIGKEMTDAVAEFTARMGAGNEALVAKFTKALTATGGESVKQAVLGGVFDLQKEIMSGNVNADTLQNAMIKQGGRLQGIVDQMVQGNVNMNVAMDYLNKQFGEGAQAALMMYQQYEQFTPEEIENQRRQMKIAEDWGNTLKTMKDEILSPIKQAISKFLPPVLEKLNEISGFLTGLLKGMTFVVAAIALKRGAGALGEGFRTGDAMGALGGLTKLGVGLGAAGLGAASIGAILGEEGEGLKLGGAAGVAGIAIGALPILATLISKKKGVLGALAAGFGGGPGGEAGKLFGKLGTKNNPMHTIDSGGILDATRNMIGFGQGGGSGAQAAAGKKGIWSMVRGGLGSIFGKTGLINKAAFRMTAPLGAKLLATRLGSRVAATSFGTMLARWMAPAAAAQVVPVLGQAVGIALAGLYCFSSS
jgi:hypothetical protein